MADAMRVFLVSDLHLGSNPSLEDFVRDDEFVKLLEAPELTPPPGGACDLVLLGDTFDLWQAVSDDECGSDQRKVPVEYGVDDERRRLEAVVTKHARLVAALGAFARRPANRLVVVPGNHDHSLVKAEVREALVTALGAGAAVTFPWSYENPSLGLYAEHGNQYDDNNKYDTFGAYDWRSDARGYYFVRLFFNRIERRDPRIENSPGGWGTVWHWLRRIGDLGLVAFAIRCFAQYARDPRVKRHLTFDAEGGSVEAPELVEHPEAPELLVAGGSKDGFFFSLDPETEQFLRDAYRSSDEVRRAVGEVLADQGRAGVEPPAGPAPAVSPVDFGPPKDAGWAEDLFTQPPALRGTPLDPEVFGTVLFGHTHEEMSVELGNGKRYVNTGSWTVWKKGGAVAIAERATPGPAAVRLRHFDGAGFVD